MLRRIAVVATLALLAAEVVLARDYLSRSLHTVLSARPFWIMLSIVAAIASMAFFARTQRRMLRAAGIDVAIPRMVGLVFEANALNVTLPGGSALSLGYEAARLRRWGASTSAAGFTLVASGALSTVTFAALAFSCAVLAGDGSWWTGVLLAGLTLVVVSVVLMHRVRPAFGAAALHHALSRVDRLAGHAGRAAGAIRTVVADLGTVRPRPRDWAIASGFAALNWLADLACLVASCQAVSANRVGFIVLLSAYLAGMSASSISVLPGGFGVIEVAMIFTLSSGGVAVNTATAGVIVYRLISCVLVVAVGWLVAGAGTLHRKLHRPEAVAPARRRADQGQAPVGERPARQGDTTLRPRTIGAARFCRAHTSPRPRAATTRSAPRLDRQTSRSRHTSGRDFDGAKFAHDVENVRPRGSAAKRRYRPRGSG